MQIWEGLPGDSEFASTWLISELDMIAAVTTCRHAASEVAQAWPSKKQEGVKGGGGRNRGLEVEK